MIQVIRSDERHSADHGWLQTRWHFSFGDYFDPDNVNWSALRVFNDDVIAGGQGFGFHPHRDMEIVTYMLEGTLEHRDNLNNRGLLRAGEVQVMSAGTGIVHSEVNASPTEPAKLIQLWITPRKKGSTPRWDQRGFSAEQRTGKLLPVAGPIENGASPNGGSPNGGSPNGASPEAPLGIDQDATVYVSRLNAGDTITYANRGGSAYLFVIHGSVGVNGQPLARGDQARIRGEKALEIKASEEAELILLDLP